LGASAREAGRHLDFASTRAFLMRQALFTLRRVIYSASLAFAGLGAAVVAMGFKFNSGMEQSQIAMTQFLGSSTARAQGARVPLQPCREDTVRHREHPYRSHDVPRVRLQRQGDEPLAGDPRRHRVGLPNLGAEGVGRLALVFGQIRASGRLLGNDLRQLASAGIPAIEIIRKQLQLSKAQVQDLMAGNLNIPSGLALEALARGLQERYRGLARLQSQSFQGLTSTAKDYFSQLSGVLTHPLFKRTENFLRTQVNPLLTQLTNAFKRKPGGDWNAFWLTLDRGVGANGRLYNAWQKMSAAAGDVARIFRESVMPAFRSALGVVAVLAPLFRLLGGTLAFAAHHTTLLRVALTPVITYFLLAKAYLIAFRLGMLGYALAVGTAGRAIRLWIILTNNARLAALLFNATIVSSTRLWQVLTLGYLRGANGQFLAMTRLEKMALRLRLTMIGLATGIRGAFTAIMVSSTRLWSVLTLGFVRGANGQFVAMTRLERVALRLRFALIGVATGIRAATAASFAFLLSPVGLIIAAVVALAVGFVILYFRVKRFRDFVNRYWPYLIAAIFPLATLAVTIRRHWDDLVSFFAGVPGRITSAARGMFDGLKDAFRGAINWIIRGWNSLSFTLPSIHVPGFGKVGGWTLSTPDIPELAAGGLLTQGGTALVGERGRELVNLPRGAKVTPLSRAGGDGDALAGISEQLGRIAQVLGSLRGDVYVDGRRAGDVLWSVRQAVEARA
jgi:hypothetical protein